MFSQARSSQYMELLYTVARAQKVSANDQSTQIPVDVKDKPFASQYNLFSALIILCNLLQYFFVAHNISVANSTQGSQVI